MTGPLLDVSSLAVSYGAVAAVRDVSLTVSAGEVVAMLGANGAGKTTTLRAVSGLVKVRGGHVRFDGADITGRHPESIARLGVAHVPAGRGIFPSLTVEDNLRMALYGCGSSDTSRMPAAMAGFPILEQKRRQPAGELSGGQQQQLAIARALVQRPRLLLVDEMSMGLAPAVVAELFGMVASLREQGVAILMVEQFVTEALRVADRAVVLEQGHVVAAGAAADIGAEAVASAYLGSAADISVTAAAVTAREELTIGLPGSTVRTIEQLAADRGGSVTELVTDAVGRLVEEAGP